MSKEDIVIDKQLMNTIIVKSLNIIDVRETSNESRNSALQKIIEMIKKEVENED